MKKKHLLFLIILIEGYVVLACELLAIRQLIPFVGSGTETISIIISAILLPLAIGYHHGGRAYVRSFLRRKQRGHSQRSVRALLLGNLYIAMTILAFGLSYPFLEVVFHVMDRIGLHHKLLQTTLYSALFLVYPIFLLGQTVPLVSNYFSRISLSEITGKMLFFSTTGSFLGSIFSTIVLMSSIGVHNTVIFTIALLCTLSLVVASKASRLSAWLSCAIIMAIVLPLNSPAAMRLFNVVSDNAYNIVSIQKKPGHDDVTLFKVNRSASSMLGSGEHRFFPYVEYIKSTLLDTLPKPGNAPPREILIIGAGGFTMGLDDHFNHYTFVDIDPVLKDVAEQHFLPEPLSDNKKFIAASARAFVRGNTNSYDLIIIDVYNTPRSIPMETTTREFLLDVKKLLRKGGVVAANIISSPDFRDAFTVRYNNTFASVFPAYTRQVIGEFTPWADTPKNMPQPPNNVVYTYYDRAFTGDHTVYTDDKNTYSLDRD